MESDPEVEEYIAQYPDEFANIMRHLRGLIYEIVPDFNFLNFEDSKYGKDINNGYYQAYNYYWPYYPKPLFTRQFFVKRYLYF